MIMKNRYEGEEEDNEDYRPNLEETPEEEYKDIYFFPISDDSEYWHNENK